MGAVVNARFAVVWKRRFAVERGLKERRRGMQYAQNAGHGDGRTEGRDKVLQKLS